MLGSKRIEKSEMATSANKMASFDSLNESHETRSLEATKVPAPDGVPNVALKAAEEMFRFAIQNYIWKRQPIVLLTKNGKPDIDIIE